MATNRVSPKKGKVVDIPTVPTVGTATAGSESATVAYTAATVGGPATTFTALSNPGSITGTGTSPITVSGLTAGTAYTFTVRGSNATGSSEYSSASGSVTPTLSTSYESIATQSVSSGTAATITFSSIPGTYKHLELRGIARVTGASNEAVKINFNSDTGSNYAEHHMVGNGTASVRGSNATYTNGAMYWGMGTPFATSTFGANVTSISDYTDTNKYKTVRSLDGFDGNGSGGIELVSSLWLSTAAITSITLTPNSGVSFNTYTHFALYGIKGA